MVHVLEQKKKDNEVFVEPNIELFPGINDVTRTKALTILSHSSFIQTDFLCIGSYFLYIGSRQFKHTTQNNFIQRSLNLLCSI